MVGLAETREDYAKKGFTPAIMARGFAQLAQEHGMPFDTSVRSAVPATVPACKEIVAVREHGGAELAGRLLRQLRLQQMTTTNVLDTPEALNGAAEAAGIDRATLDAWVADPSTEEALRADMAAARTPDAASLQLTDRLAKWEGGWRYTCPSLVLEADGALVGVPGFQPGKSYDVAQANIAPELERAEPGTDPVEILAWAGEPLATAEVAAIMERPLDETRTACSRPLPPSTRWAPTASGLSSTRARGAARTTVDAPSVMGCTEPSDGVACSTSRTGSQVRESLTAPLTTHRSIHASSFPRRAARRPRRYCGRWPAMAADSPLTVTSTGKKGTLLLGSPTTFTLKGTFPAITPTLDGNTRLRAIEAKLPDTLVFNPKAVKPCSTLAFMANGPTACSTASKIGTATLIAAARRRRSRVTSPRRLISTTAPASPCSPTSTSTSRRRSRRRSSASSAARSTLATTRPPLRPTASRCTSRSPRR